MAEGCPLEEMAQKGGSCADCAQYHSAEPCVLRKTQKRADAIEKKLNTIEQLLYTIQRDVRSSR
jgi:hypothetical protein